MKFTTMVKCIKKFRCHKVHLSWEQLGQILKCNMLKANDKACIRLKTIAKLLHT